MRNGLGQQVPRYLNILIVRFIKVENVYEKNNNQTKGTDYIDWNWVFNGRKKPMK